MAVHCSSVDDFVSVSLHPSFGLLFGSLSSVLVLGLVQPFKSFKSFSDNNNRMTTVLLFLLSVFHFLFLFHFFSLPTVSFHFKGVVGSLLLQEQRTKIFFPGDIDSIYYYDDRNRVVVSFLRLFYESFVIFIPLLHSLLRSTQLLVQCLSDELQIKRLQVVMNCLSSFCGLEVFLVAAVVSIVDVPSLVTAIVEDQFSQLCENDTNRPDLDCLNLEVKTENGFYVLCVVVLLGYVLDFFTM